MECAWLNYVGPYVAHKRVVRLVRILFRAAKALEGGDDKARLLNIAHFFFVSRYLAEAFPHLPASAIVNGFCSHIPEGDVLRHLQSLGGGYNARDPEDKKEPMLEAALMRVLLYIVSFPLGVQLSILRFPQQLITSGFAKLFQDGMSAPEPSTVKRQPFTCPSPSGRHIMQKLLLISLLLHSPLSKRPTPRTSVPNLSNGNSFSFCEPQSETRSTRQ